MDNFIGKNINYYRNIRRLTRKDLITNICDESTLFRIEKGQQLPGIYLLKRISDKLGIPIGYLTFNNCETTQYLNRIKKICREFVYNDDYFSLQNIIEETSIFLTQNKNNIHIIDSEFDRFIEWHQAILLIKNANEPDKAKIKLINLLKKQKANTEININITNSLGLVHLSLSEYDLAYNCFKTAYESSYNLPIIDDKTLYIRVGYNYIYVLMHKEDYESAFDVAYKLVDYVKANNLLYTNGELFHLLGLLHERNKSLGEAEKFMQRATTYFLIEDKKLLYIKALRALSELQFKQDKYEKALTNLNSVEKILSTSVHDESYADLLEDIIRKVEYTKNTYLRK